MPKKNEPRGFNAFDVLRISHENYYSRVFAWLLDPTASHGKKRFFLDWFLRKCGVRRRAKFLSVETEEALGGDEQFAKNRTDIALRCEGMLFFIEIKINRQAIRKGQLRTQHRYGASKASEEGLEFQQVFLAPDEGSLDKVVLSDCTLLTWTETIEFLKKHLSRAKPPRDTAARDVDRFLHQFVDHVERSILGQFRGLDPSIFKRRFLGLGGHVDEEAVRVGLRDFFVAVDREVRKKLPLKTGAIENSIRWRRAGHCVLFYFTNGHKGHGIELTCNTEQGTMFCSVRADTKKYRSILFDRIEKLEPKTQPLKVDRRRVDIWTEISDDLWNINDQTKMLDDCVDHLVTYIKVFGPEMRAFQREHGLKGKLKSTEIDE